MAPTSVTSGFSARHHGVGSASGLPGSLLHFPHLAPQSSQRLTFADASPHHSYFVVQEYLPVVHHLRLPASAKARLTRRGLTFRRKPRGFGAYGSHACFATHAGILTGVLSTPGSPDASSCTPRSPTNSRFTLPFRGFGGKLEPRYIIRAAAFDQ